MSEYETDFNAGVVENVSQYSAASPDSPDMVKCRITRDRKGIEKFGYPTYNCFLDDGRNARLVLCARKRKKAKASTYLIATNHETLNKESFVAKLKSNIVGTRYDKLEILNFERLVDNYKDGRKLVQFLRIIQKMLHTNPKFLA